MPEITKAQELNHQAQLERNKQLNESNLVEYQLVNQVGQNAIKSSIIVNSGAAISVLSFLGSVINKGNSFNPYCGYALLAFALGVFCAVVSVGVVFMAHLFWAKKGDEKSFKKWQNCGHAFNYISITLTTLSYICFLIGCISFYYGITS